MTRHRGFLFLAYRLEQGRATRAVISISVIFALAMALAPPAAALDIPVGDQYQLAFYGFLNPAVTWDSRGSKGVDWAFASPNSAREDSAFGINVRNTRLGLDFAPKPEAGIAVRGKAEVDFVDSGDTGGFPKSIRIRHLYGTFDLWGLTVLVGQTWSFLHQIEPATVNTTNLFGQGHIYDRVPQVRVSKELGDFRVALLAQVTHTAHKRATTP